MPVISAESLSRPDWVQPFVSAVPGGDLQTIVARYWPASIDEARFPTEERFFDTEPGVRILAKVNRAGGDVTVLLVHGLAACTEARYMLTLAARALETGYDVIRVNVRNCGGTEHLCPTLYHSGLTIDWRRIVEQLAPRPLLLVGFSMGGNQVLKLAGEWGESPPAHVLGVCGVSVPIRLDVCSRRIGEFRNRIYEVRFLRQLGETVRVKQRLMPEVFGELESRHPSVWEFDDKVTAPAFGFAGAADYYANVSAAGYLEKIRLPALLIAARDDPFVPFTPYEDAVFARNPRLTLLETRSGGHVAFLAKGRKRFWAEEQVLAWLGTLLG